MSPWVQTCQATPVAPGIWAAQDGRRASGVVGSGPAQVSFWATEVLN